MSVEVGQIYYMASYDPFSKQDLIQIIEKKEDTKGDEWVKYCFVKDENGKMKLGTMEFSCKVEHFLNMFSLYSDVKDKDNPIIRFVKNAILQLEA